MTLNLLNHELHTILAGQPECPVIYLPKSVWQYYDVQIINEESRVAEGSALP